MSSTAPQDAQSTLCPLSAQDRKVASPTGTPLAARPAALATLGSGVGQPWNSIPAQVLQVILTCYHHVVALCFLIRYTGGYSIATRWKYRHFVPVPVPVLAVVVVSAPQRSYSYGYAERLPHHHQVRTQPPCNGRHAAGGQHPPLERDAYATQFGRDFSGAGEGDRNQYTATCTGSVPAEIRPTARIIF